MGLRSGFSVYGQLKDAQGVLRRFESRRLLIEDGNDSSDEETAVERPREEEGRRDGDGEADHKDEEHQGGEEENRWERPDW